MLPLPPEILDHILSFLQSDTATLKTCFRSHPILSQLVERYLYAYVTFQDFSSLPREDLSKVLRDRPHVANYVFAINIRFDGDSCPMEDISHILPKLSRLRRIRLCNTSCYAVSWQRLPKKFRLAILDCLWSQSMTDICTEYIAFPLSTLRYCKHIRNLSLRGWSDDPMMAESNGDVPTLPTIDSLALHDCCPISLSTVVSWIESGHLSSLQFSESNRHSSSNVLYRIIICSSHSLTNLDVDIGRTYRSFYNFNRSNKASHPNNIIPIPLSNLPHLQQLTVRAQLDYISNNPERSSATWGFLSPIPAITVAVKPISRVNLPTLDFHFLVKFRRFQYNQRRITDVLCTPLHYLLVQSASIINSINLQISSTPVPGSPSISPDTILLTFVGDHSYLKHLVENGKLILDADAPMANTKPQPDVQLPFHPGASGSTSRRTLTAPQ